MKSTPHSKGIALIELVGVLVLLAVFSIVSAKLFYAIMRVSVEARHAPRPDRQREALEDQLRADAWTAIEMRAGGDDSLILRYAGDRSVIWRLQPAESALRRTAFLGQQAQDEQAWPQTSAPDRFENFGPGVRLHWSAQDQRGENPLDLYSSLILLSGGGP